MTLLYRVLVGFSTVRPIIADQHLSLVTVLADTDREAFFTAFSMVYGRPQVQMVTRCDIQEVEL